MADKPESPRYWLNKLRSELYSEVLPWWIKYSLDEENGGYYNCIHEDGSILDFGKYVVAGSCGAGKIYGNDM